jgi:DNA (cytosine-5)-methyltransferase 1
MRGATLFSGGGGAEALLRSHINFVHAVEYDAHIAAVYAANIGPHVQVARVEDVDYSLWGALDYLHASPVCKEYSAAKTNGAEGEGDLSSAAAVVRCLEATQPRVFTLENVGAYQHGQAFRLIVQWLNHNGYMWHAEVLNAADFGVPQTRRRLILRAVRDALLPTLPPPVKWVGWYAAIEDLIPSLPESQFAPWQLARLPEGLQETALVEGTEMRGEITPFLAATPSFTIKAAQYKGLPRAFIVDGQTNDAGACVTVPHSDAPMYTVSASCDRRPARAFLIPIGTESQPRYEEEPAHTTTSSHYKNMPKGWLATGRVVKMTPRALARFQSFPDWYVLPEKSALACTVIGNAAPSLMMCEIVSQLI